MTHACENITFPQLLLRAVKTWTNAMVKIYLTNPASLIVIILHHFLVLSIDSVYCKVTFYWRPFPVQLKGAFKYSGFMVSFGIYVL